LLQGTFDFPSEGLEDRMAVTRRAVDSLEGFALFQEPLRAGAVDAAACD
jgi:hypothetical protein